MDLEQIRREYLMGGLRRKQLPADPLVLMERWLTEAVASKIPDPTAFVLATVSADGGPNQRIVLLKHLDADGFVFYTNYSSNKAVDIASQPKVSLHFPWHGMERQVCVQGKAEQISRQESASYFTSRPFESQIAAMASHQSRPIASRKVLLDEFETLQKRYDDQNVPSPNFWGGYRIRPECLEFWQGGANRLHDRFKYQRRGDVGWDIERLAP